jgi:hypothetical protein
MQYTKLDWRQENDRLELAKRTELESIGVEDGWTYSRCFAEMIFWLREIRSVANNSFNAGTAAHFKVDRFEREYERKFKLLIRFVSSAAVIANVIAALALTLAVYGIMR